LIGSQLNHGIQLPEQWQDRLPGALGCSGRSVELVQGAQRLLTVAPGTELFAQNSDPKAIYLLLDGAVDVVGCRGQREARLGQITSGMLFDIAACILGAPHNFTARSVSTCALVFLPIDVWRRLIEEFPSASIKAASQLCTNLRDIVRQIASR
jgi:CRP-like cAMP-binding protein